MDLGWHIDIMMIGKIVLSLIMLFFSGVFLIIIFNFAKWYVALLTLEKVAEAGRDEVMFAFIELRSRIYGLRNRAIPQEIHPDSGELLKHLGMFALLFLNKERSLYQICILGWKLGNSAISYFKGQKERASFFQF